MQCSEPKKDRDLKMYLYCDHCNAETKDECFCNRIIGYDPCTGYDIVDLTEEDLVYLSNSSAVAVGGA